MNNSIRLLERVRLTTPNKSKEQTIKALQMDRATLYGIYKEKRFPNAMHCAEISKITGISIQDVITYVAADKSKSEETKELVRIKLPRLLPTAGLAIALLVGGYTTANNRNEFAGNKGLALNANIHYAQYRKKFAQKAKEWLRRFLTVKPRLWPISSAIATA